MKLIYDRVRPRIRTHTVQEALVGAWPEDVGPDLSSQLLVEFLRRWERTTQVEFTGTMDSVRLGPLCPIFGEVRRCEIYWAQA